MQDEDGILHFLYPMPPREAASLPGCPAGGVCAASGLRRFEGSGSCLPFHCPTAQRPRTRRAAPPPTGPGDRRSGGARDASKGRRPRSRRRRRPQSKRRGKARAPPATTRAQGARGPRANPLPPALKYRIRRPPGRDGGRGEAHSAARGEGGEPPRGRAPTCADATGAAGTGKQGAGRSARPPAERRHAQSSGPRSQERPRALARKGRAANGHTESSQGPTGAERAKAVVSSRRRARSVRPEAAQPATATRPERSGAALAVGYYSLPFWRALRSILTAWVE